MIFFYIRKEGKSPKNYKIQVLGVETPILSWKSSSKISAWGFGMLTKPMGRERAWFAKKCAQRLPSRKTWLISIL